MGSHAHLLLIGLSAKLPPMQTTDVAIIGAGPIGLELAVALKDAGVEYLQFDAKQIAHTISWYPKQTPFFSSPDRIAICGVPLNTSDQSKATREEYLAYLRGIVEQFDLDIHTYEPVETITKQGDAFVLSTRHAGEARQYEVKRIVMAVGDMHRPRMLNIPGEDLPHVSHYFDEAHAYFKQRVLIVGGRNSAVEAAIRCCRAGADVHLSYRHDEFDGRSVKYWLKPEIEWLIKSGQITFHSRTLPVAITERSVKLRSTQDNSGTKIDADFVLLLTGYEMDTSMLESLGVQLVGENRAPEVDVMTMQTNVPGVYVAGTAAAGTQQRFKLFIENCHPHVIRIARALAGDQTFEPPHINALAFRRLDENPLATIHESEVGDGQDRTDGHDRGDGSDGLEV